MAQTPSRKSTQPGLGQVVKADARRTTARPREDERVESEPPTSARQGVNAISSDAPPPESGLTSGRERITKPTQTKWFTPPPEGSFRNPSNDPPPWTKHPTAKIAPPRKESASPPKEATKKPAASTKPTVTATPSAKRGSSAPPARNASASAAAAAAAKKKNRASIRVDDVGDGGVGIVADGSGLGPKMVPRVLRSKQELAAAPIDHREGFVLALVDGSTTVQGVVDVSGMELGAVMAILQRLRRLGIIAVR